MVVVPVVVLVTVKKKAAAPIARLSSDAHLLSEDDHTRSARSVFSFRGRVPKLGFHM